jgi:hypothetical protein
MKMLTVRQPWASLIVFGEMQYENRKWTTDYRGPLVIHAAERMYPGARKIIPPDDLEILLPPVAFSCRDDWSGDCCYDDLPLGKAIGVAELVDVLSFDRMTARQREDWSACGPFCWKLRNARPFTTGGICCSGRTGLFDPPADVAAEAREALRSSRRPAGASWARW